MNKLLKCYGYLFVISLSLKIFLLNSCSSAPNLSKRYKYGLENKDNYISPQSVDIANYIGEFRIFDPTYDFVKNGIDTAESLSHSMPIRDHNVSQVSNLKHPSDFLAMRYAMISKAKRSIRMQYFTFWGDESGWEIGKKLIELKKQGIDIKIIIDPYSNLYPNSQSMFFKFKQNGIEVLGYEVAYMYALNMLSPKDDIEEVMNKFNRRFHEKLLVVDAELPDSAIAIVGGANIGNKYFKIENGLSAWRDKDVVLKGLIVQDIARAFDNNFIEIKQYRENQALMNTDQIWKIAVFVRDVLKLPPIFNPNLKLNNNLIRIVQNKIQQPVILNWYHAKMRYLYNKPHKNQNYVTAAYVDLINSSKSEILILNSYFLVSNEIREMIKNAVKRGVNVKILTNAKEVTDNILVNVASRATYADLLKINEVINNGAKLEIFEWQGHKILNNNEGLHHAKYAIFDKRVVIVGSYNLDPRSRYINTECAIAIDSLELAQELSQEFYSEIQPNYSKSISLSEALKFSDPQDIIGRFEKEFAESLKPML